MLSRETEQKLVELFIALSIGEEKINKLKENILSNFNINPIKIFFKLDINNEVYLSKNDIISFLNYFSINVIPTDIDYIFYFYDKDNDNTLSFYEFLDLILSDSNYLYKKSFKKRFKYNKINQNEMNNDIDINIEKSILEIFLEEIDFSRQLDNLKINIKKNKDFSIQNVFYEIKSYSYITSDSLKAFFDRNEISYNDRFIKNIFNRFDNKEINGKISFNKFKNFFDLPYIKDKNINIQITGNSFPKTIIQTFISSEDIKFNNSNEYGNIGYTTINQSPNLKGSFIQNDYNINKINNENYINEEDIQFQCSHLSRSGSIESNKKDKNRNFKYISKNNNKNNLYRNYLREKRSKSLEKSCSKSFSRTNEFILKTDNRSIFDKNNNIRNIRQIEDNYLSNNSLNEDNHMNDSGSSFHEDLPIRCPIRLDKNLVKRKSPQRKDNNQNKFNFLYDDHFKDLKINSNKINNRLEKEQYYIKDYYNNPHHYNLKKHNDFYNKQNMINFGNEMEMSYNDEILYQEGKFDDDKFSSNNLDLKIYQEDITSQADNGRY